MTAAGGAPGTARDGYRARPAEPTGELLDDEWWLRLFHVTSEAVDFVPYDAASEYPVPHVAALRAAAGPLLAPLLAKLRAVESVMARCNACRDQAAQVNRPAVAMAYDDAAEWIRRALDAS